MIPSQVRTRLDRVYEAWAARPCFVCRKRLCEHREIDVEYALIDAELARALRPQERENKVTPMKRRHA